MNVASAYPQQSGGAPVKRALRALLARVANTPGLDGVFHWAWGLRERGRKLHPIDERLGIDTGGHISGALVAASGDHNPYLGCVPSAVATALRTIPNPETATFTDLGCGKGRALAVAHGFPFAAVRGVELSGPLAKAARRNAALLARANPAGPPIEIVHGDASAPALPAGDSVYFMYHPFGEASMKKLCATLAAQAAGPHRVFVIYDNPVLGALFDAEGAFHRWFAKTMPYAPEEMGYSTDTDECIVIWANHAAGAAPSRADGEIVVTKPGWRVDVQERQSAG